MTPYGNIVLGQHWLSLLTDGTSHYLSQDGLLIGEVLWHSNAIHFALCAQANILYEFKNYTYNIFASAPRVQWVHPWCNVPLSHCTLFPVSLMRTSATTHWPTAPRVQWVHPWCNVPLSHCTLFPVSLMRTSATTHWPTAPRVQWVHPWCNVSLSHCSLFPVSLMRTSATTHWPTAPRVQWVHPWCIVSLSHCTLFPVSFSKAFDKVAHNRLLYKIDRYTRQNSSLDQRLLVWKDSAGGPWRTVLWRGACDIRSTPGICPGPPPVSSIHKRYLNKYHITNTSFCRWYNHLPAYNISGRQWGPAKGPPHPREMEYGLADGFSPG